MDGNLLVLEIAKENKPTCSFGSNNQESTFSFDKTNTDREWSTVARLNVSGFKTLPSLGEAGKTALLLNPSRDRLHNQKINHDF